MHRVRRPLLAIGRMTFSIIFCRSSADRRITSPLQSTTHSHLNDNHSHYHWWLFICLSFIVDGWFGVVMVTALVTSTKLSYVEPAFHPRHSRPLSLAIPPSAVNTGDGIGHLWKKRRVLRSGGPWYQDHWHTGLLGLTLTGSRSRGRALSWQTWRSYVNLLIFLLFWRLSRLSFISHSQNYFIEAEHTSVDSIELSILDLRLIFGMLTPQKLANSL